MPFEQPPREVRARYYVTGLMSASTGDPSEIRRHALHYLQNKIAAHIADAMTVERRVDPTSDHVVYEANVIVLTPRELMDYVEKAAQRLALSVRRPL